MSIDDGITFWIGDLDGYVTIRGDLEVWDEAYSEEVLHVFEQPERTRQEDLDALGDLQLFAGKSICARKLYDRGVPPEEWRWAIHQAEHALQGCSSWTECEPLFIKDLLSLGRRYAVARYSKWENISFPAALTATFTHGFRALLDQFLVNSELSHGTSARNEIQVALQNAFEATDRSAYHRASIIRSTIHNCANEQFGPSGHLELSKVEMRSILSLARLHYSAAEIRVKSIQELQRLDQLYANARSEVQKGTTTNQTITGTCRTNWSLRHLHPLTFLYPFSIRYAIDRAVHQLSASPSSSPRIAAINELALARCSIARMRRLAKDGPKSQ